MTHTQPKPTLKDRVKKAIEVVEEHKYTFVFCGGMLVGGKLVMNHYEEILGRDMQVQLAPSEIQALLAQTTDGLVSAASDGKQGRIIMTLHPTRP